MRYTNFNFIRITYRSIYAFWYCVLNDTERFCDLIDSTPITIESWQKQNKIQQLKSSIYLLNTLLS